jgi:serine-type D-Ala-D-Ala endopeptidase (penicillin-binding protein 7)
MGGDKSMVFNDLSVIPIKRFSILVAAVLALSQPLAVHAKSPSAKTEESDSANKKPQKKHVAKSANARPKAKSNAQPKRQAKASKKRVQTAQKSTVRKQTLAAKRHQQKRLMARAPARLSVGQQMGLHGVDDPLSLSASVALVIDQSTNEVLFSKNGNAVLPIASLTKLMTGLVVADAQLPLDEEITITREDIDTLKGSRSRLSIGTRLTRGELMHLALMSSENRAAHALGRTHPGGIDQFVRDMNQKAVALGMTDSRFVDPTGLSSGNQSSARDLATLAAASYNQPIMRELSTSPGYRLAVGRKTLQYNNSNGLVRSDNWDIGLQKTGYISEAGRCLVMQATVAGREVIMVFLDSVGKVGRLRDAERVRHWMEAQDNASPVQAKLLPRG